MPRHLRQAHAVYAYRVARHKHRCDRSTQTFRVPPANDKNKPTECGNERVKKNRNPELKWLLSEQVLPLDVPRKASNFPFRDGENGNGCSRCREASPDCETQPDHGAF